MPRLEVRVAALDAQHRELFARINRLWDAYQAEDGRGVEEVLGFLAEYADLHFRCEEELMSKTGYPDAVRHRSLHDEFRRRVREIGDRAAAGHGAVGEELLQYLREWLVHHIGQEDRRLGAHLGAQGID